MGNTVPHAGEVWMPWKECSVVDERLRFVAQLLDGEAMSGVCRAFGISRKTGYKIFERYKEPVRVSSKATIRGTEGSPGSSGGGQQRTVPAVGFDGARPRLTRPSRSQGLDREVKEQWTSCARKPFERQKSKRPGRVTCSDDT
jgi:hypothetical protein